MSSPATGTAVSLAVVIPTCDRASLAIAACRSLLDQPGGGHVVVLSDNSTREDQRQMLASFCERLRDPRVLYIRPDAPLPMPSHWNWAIAQALARTRASHLVVHYDRRVTRRGQLQQLADAARDFPEDVITFGSDHVADEPPPATLWQIPWTGRLYEMRTARVIALTAQCRINDMGQAFPILSNCVVPGGVLDSLRERFGDFCDSTGPDSCFTYRFCALHERYLHLDRPIGIIYAPHRSNGMGYLRQTGGDFGNFVEAWADRPWLEAAPIPGVNLGQNMMFHEYELVRRAVGSARFPPIDRDLYLSALKEALRWIRDPKVKADMRTMLEAQGMPPAAAEAAAPRTPITWQTLPHRVVRRLRYEVRRYATPKRRQTVSLFLADAFRIYPEHITGYTFRDDAKALRYGLKLPRPPQPDNPLLDPLEPCEVSRKSGVITPASQT